VKGSDLDICHNRMGWSTEKYHTYFLFDFLPGFCVQEYYSSSLQGISGMPICTADIMFLSRSDPNLCVYSFGSRKKGSKLTMLVKYLLFKNGCNNEKETTVSA
jgi:hypothetical protein